MYPLKVMYNYKMEYRNDHSEQHEELIIYVKVVPYEQCSGCKSLLGQR